MSCADITSVENALNTINKFGCISGLKLNVKKTKALWLGRWATSHLTWTRDPVKILEIYFSYDEKQSNHFTFEPKIQNLQCKLDVWKSRNFKVIWKSCHH